MRGPFVIQASFRPGHGPRHAPPRPAMARGPAGATEMGAPGWAELRPSGPGRPLDPSVRARMEEALGADFADVRVHVGPQASRLGAQAYTVGADIVFAPGEYEPHTWSGRRLLAHELVHVLQQRQGRVRVPPRGGPVVQDPLLEGEAERLGGAAADGVRTARAPNPASADAGAKPAQMGRRKTKLNPKQKAQQQRLLERWARRHRQNAEQRIRARLAHDCATSRLGPSRENGGVYADLSGVFRDVRRDLRDAALADRGLISAFIQRMTGHPLVNAFMQLISHRFRMAQPQPRQALGAHGQAPIGPNQAVVPALPGAVPRPLPRVRFSVWPAFQASDIGSRAVIDLVTMLDTTVGWRGAPDPLEVGYIYRTHPQRYDLTSDMGTVLRGNAQPFALSFPSDTGEVMYVITEDYRIVIAARSGRQRDLPHPSLIGGLDPLALGGGLVEFRDGRILRVLIHSSGHFRPGGTDATEVALALFDRLPPGAFHRDFQGFQIYGAARPVGAGRRLTGGQAPFAITEGPEVRGTTETTRAMTTSRHLANFERARNTLIFERQLNSFRQSILIYLFNADEEPPIHLMPSRQARRWFQGLVRAAARLREQLIAEWIKQRAGTVRSFQDMVDIVIARELG